jgi:23S rRNA (adenine2030-N6)-methyltransferase
MLAYRHAFHAGNHADVLKHLVLTRVLRYMAEKDKPYTLIDTHAGAGGYSVEGRYAQKKGEYAEGVARLYDRKDLPAPLADYVEPGARLQPRRPAAPVPGFAGARQQLLRETDRMRAYELHPTDHRILEATWTPGRTPRSATRTAFVRHQGRAALAHAPRRAADGPVLRDQERLRQGAGGACARRWSGPPTRSS